MIQGYGEWLSILGMGHLYLILDKDSFVTIDITSSCCTLGQSAEMPRGIDVSIPIWSHMIGQSLVWNWNKIPIRYRMFG